MKNQDAKTYWEAEMAKAEEKVRSSKSKAQAKKANLRMMECRMAMRDAVRCSVED